MERVTVWAREHKGLAVGVVIAVIVLLFLLFRGGGKSSGGDPLAGYYGQIAASRAANAQLAAVQTQTMAAVAMAKINADSDVTIAGYQRDLQSHLSDNQLEALLRGFSLQSQRDQLAYMADQSHTQAAINYGVTTLPMILDARRDDNATRLGIAGYSADVAKYGIASQERVSLVNAATTRAVSADQAGAYRNASDNNLLAGIFGGIFGGLGGAGGISSLIGDFMG